ncbi:MAG: hypothetical protein JOZ65_09465 [Chloroflexi bacterium]|nr:hypothetical protein [Chloroflexota bacterium]
MTALIEVAGPLVAVALALTLATRALAVAGGPNVRLPRRLLSRLTLLLMVFFAMTLALHFLVAP